VVGRKGRIYAGLLRIKVRSVAPKMQLDGWQKYGEFHSIATDSGSLGPTVLRRLEVKDFNVVAFLNRWERMTIVRPSPLATALSFRRSTVSLRSERYRFLIVGHQNGGHLVRLLRLIAFVALGSLIFSPTTLFCQSSSARSQEITWTYNSETANEPCPLPAVCSVWLDFRKSHPWPYQAIAVRELAGEAVIIVSEPPPALTRAQYRQVLQALFGDRILDFGYCRWSTGVDGYLEDIVLRVRAGEARRLRFVSADKLEFTDGPESVVDRLRLFYRLEYGTSDGFSLEMIAPRAQTEVPLKELKIPVSDLAGWVTRSSAQWTHVEDEALPPATISDLYRAKSPGTFQNQAGIIALVAPKNARLADLRVPFRRFAVASDIILGALGNKSGAMILLGRSRTVPFSVLPPLRFESFASFARNRAEDIAQSYERQRIFAGRIENGRYAGWDWAPILLSPQLDDTEVGTLLNLADQILKSWSEHGQVEYYAFRYPQPPAFPFGEEAASDYFRRKFQTTSLVFNWNTENFSAIARTKSEDILTASRTGALRILYRPADSLSLSDDDQSSRRISEDAQQKAALSQDYFANLGNPILMRVVQNVLLYQAEQSFLTVADPQEPPRRGRSDRVQSVMEQQAAKWLNAAAQHQIIGSENERLVALINRKIQESGLTPSQLAALIASPQKIMISIERQRQLALKSLHDAEALSEQAKETDKVGRASFTAACESAGGTLSNEQSSLNCHWSQKGDIYAQTPFQESTLLHAQLDQEVTASKKAFQVFVDGAKAAEDLEDKYVKASETGKMLTQLSSAADLDMVLDHVLEAAVASGDAGFIRTPSVVLSTNSIDVDSIGGHNIGLVPPRFTTEIRDATTFSKPVMSKPQVVTAASKQIGILPMQIISEAPRPVEEVLGHPPTGSLLEKMRSIPKPDARAFQQISARAKTCNCDAIIAKNDDGSILFVRTAPPPVERVILGKSGVIDAIAGPPPMKTVEFDGFDRATVENLARTQVLLDAKANSGASSNLMADIKSAFSGDGGIDGGGAEVLIAREGREPESLTLIGKVDERVSLQEDMLLRESLVKEPSVSEWEQTFGTDSFDDGTPRARLMVRFGAMDRRPGTLGISADPNPGLVPRMRALVAEWIHAQTVRPKPISESILTLRAAIEAHLKPNHLRFYLARNGGVIRAAHLEIPAEPGFFEETGVLGTK
jgi:hypothetical protein